MADRVTADDLAFAVDWLDCYQPDTEELMARAERVQAWLRAEIGRRQQDAVIREAAKQLGRKPSEVKAAMRRKAARDAATRTPEAAAL